MTIQNYINQLNTRYRAGRSTEHSYRGDLQALLTDLCDNVLVTNEPTRSACGAPDYILTRREIPIGYIEAKDIGADLTDKKYKEQFDRYKSSLPNLIFTNYLDFRLYLNGEFKYSISIGHIENGEIIGSRDKYDEFITLINDFSSYTGQTIKSSKKLAIMMAGKAKLLAKIIENALIEDDNSDHLIEDNTLREQLYAFKDVLIHDIKPKGFADIYAQTIAYGMFAARLHDPSLDTFTRQEAAALIPKSNPFLRKLFQYIAGYDLDDRIKWLVDALADIFRATDVAALLKDFGKATQQHDPMIHFYETFLGEYDSKLRKSRGVWYTPEPVVNFIVRAVDDILKTEFELNDGLADTTKTKITVDSQVTDLRSKTGYKRSEHEVHKVQILDPAAGTGTFLAEVIKQIYKKFKGQQGIWSRYLEKDLIPRLNGFEILMASYAMAHLKLDLLLEETGYKPTLDQRLKIYLTNSLEEHHPDTGTLFANWLSTEANEANHIKRDTPVMCVIGNPPYSVSSSNKGEWINNLVGSYKNNVDEINKNALSDDYVKFIRYGHYLIDKTGEGILAYISNNSYLDGITHRQMRKDLSLSFNKIYVINLHGDTKKGEGTDLKSKEENVFDIQQGVSINIFIKTSSKNDQAEVLYTDVFGQRQYKYNFLNHNSILSINWIKLNPDDYYNFFIPKDFSAKKDYDQFIRLDKLFYKKGGGIKFRKDNLLVKEHFSRECVVKMLADLNNLDNSDILTKYNFKETSDWSLNDKKKFFVENDTENIKKVTYRPFDYRFTYYPNKTINEIITRGDSKKSFMANIKDDNLVLITTKKNRQLSQAYFFLSKNIFDLHLLDSAGDSLQSFPLYTFSTNLDINSNTRQCNIVQSVIDEFCISMGVKFTSVKKTNDPALISPINIIDYIYAILHSPTYREKYKEFLKIDFPRIPYPKNKKTFWKFVELGSQLRKIHLLESPVVDQFITTYPIDGDNEVTRRITSRSPGYETTNKTKGRVWINDQQYFDGVPLVAWEFYIGGYQPAQKWLKDRRGRKLDYDDIRHYQRIIVALKETDRLMKEIDKIKFE